MALDSTIWNISRVCCCVVDLIVLFLNPIIIAVIYNDRQLKKQPSPIYIANVAFVDLCLAVLSLAHLVFSFMGLEKEFWLCATMHGLFLAFPMASLLFMFTNSVDRFVFIKMSLKYHILMNMKVVKYVMIILWAFSISCPLFPYLILGHVWDFNTCKELYLSDTNRYAHFPLYIVFLMSIVLTAVMFISVFRVVKKSGRLRQLPSTSSLSTRQSATSESAPSSPILLQPIEEWVLHSKGNSDQGIYNKGNSDQGIYNKGNSDQGICNKGNSDQGIYNKGNSDQSIYNKGNSDQGICNKGNSDQGICNKGNNDQGISDETISSNAVKTQAHQCLRSDSTSSSGQKPPLVLFGNQRNNGDSSSIEVKINNPVYGNCYLETNHFHVEANRGVEKAAKTVPVYDIKLNEYFQFIKHPWEKNIKDELRCHYTFLESRSSLETHSTDVLINADTILANTALSDQQMYLIQRQTMCPPFHQSYLYSQDRHLHTSTSLWDKTTFIRNENITYCCSCSLPFGNDELSWLSLRSDSFSLMKVTSQNNSPCLSPTLTYFHAPGSDVCQMNIKPLTIDCLASSQNLLTESPVSSAISNPDHETRISKNMNDINTLTASMFSLINFSGKLKPTPQSKLGFQFQDIKRQLSEKIPFQTLTPISLSMCHETSMVETWINFDNVDTEDDKTETSNQPDSTDTSPKDKEDAGKISKSQRLHRQPEKYQLLRPVSNSTNISASFSSTPFGVTCHSGRDIRTFKILFLMFCVYISLWFPSLIMRMMRDFHIDVSVEVIVTGFTLGVLNSVVNYFVYPMRIPRLRYLLKQLFKDKVKRFLTDIRKVCSLKKK